MEKCRIEVCDSAWFRFFRVVNLPTVPGDVIVGAAAVAWGTLYCPCSVTMVSFAALPIVAACIAALAIYLFGLADNDIVGATMDGPERPIPAGEISLRAAHWARMMCLLVAAVLGGAAQLSAFWWGTALLLVAAIVVYNRTKNSLLMGCCRGLNVACGGAALICGVECADGARVLTVANGFAAPWGALLPLEVAIVLWTLYIASVTRYSEGEEGDPAKRRFVGFLVGAIVYLQLAALMFFFVTAPCLTLRNLLLVGAGMLILLRLLKRAFPKVSAS